jgi:hypothetical protein
MKKLVSTFFLLIGLLGFAQIYPVQLTHIFNSPYSSKLADYTNTFEPKFQLLVNTTDFAITNRQVRLKLIVEGNGIKAESSDFIIAPAPIYINGGELMTLTNSDLGYLFKLENLQGINPLQYSSFLPEGMYSFCFEMYDMMTNQRISRSSCAYLYLMLNDPPFLNLPAKKEQIMATDFPNIFFSWTPRNGNVTNVSYHFEIKEILDPTIDPEYGFLMSPLLYEETLYTTAFVYDLGKPALLPGKRYAWRVKAISTGGLSENAVFKNDGYSEIYWFTYATNCNAPAFVLAQLQGSKSVKITWQGNNVMHNKYHLQYRKSNVADAEWFSTYTQNEQATINDLEANQAYEYRVGASCEPPTTASSYTYSGINHFETPAQGQKTDFSCGLNPAITISNQTPIKNLLAGETFTAGDFPIKILSINPSPLGGGWEGAGYVTVPYLNDTKIAVAFKNIKINSDYQLIDGVVETTYDENWANVQPIDPIIEEIFGPQTGEETPKSSEDSQDVADNGNNSENNNSTTQTGDDTNSDTNTQTSNNTPVADNTTQTGNSQDTTTGENTTQNNTNNTNNGSNTVNTGEKNKTVTFALDGLTVKQNNTARIAKEGETLYFVNKPITTDTRILDFELNTKPNLDEKEIPKENIKWFLSQKELTTYIGKKIVTKIPVNDKISTFTISTTAGYPTATSKSVNVKWVDENLKNINVASKLGPILKIFDEINYWSNEFKTFGIPCKVEILQNLERVIKKGEFSLSYETKNEEDNKSRYYKAIDEFEFSASGAEIFNLSCEKEVTIAIPFTDKKIPIVSAEFGVSAGLKGSIKIVKERQIETNKTTYDKSRVSGGGYVTPFISASILGVKGKVDIEAGVKFEYPYKNDPFQVGIIFYTSDITGKVEISKDVSVFVTNSFTYELFRLSTERKVEMFNININTLIK